LFSHRIYCAVTGQAGGGCFFAGRFEQVSESAGLWEGGLL
jgi:hypothetical protein